MFYSSSPRVRNRQIAGDSVTAVWCLLWFYIGYLVHRLINELAAAGTYLAGSGRDIKDAGTGGGGLGSLARSFTSPLNSLGNSLSNAGASQVHAVHHVAFGVGLIIALGPTVPVLAHRLFVRWVWVKAAKLFADRHSGPASQALLAQRALINQPLASLLHISSDPVADVAAGNLAPYAALERSAHGH